MPVCIRSRTTLDTRIRKIISLKKKVDAVLSLNKLCFKRRREQTKYKIVIRVFEKDQKGPMIKLFI